MISSKVLYTEEIDDLEAAAEELTGQASGFELGSSTVGIMFMDVDTEYEELYDNLKEKWTFPLVAATAIGMLTGQGGYAKGGISVMLLTSSDCKFAVGMTEGLTVANHVEVITKTYNELEKELGEEAKLVLTYGAKAAELAGDDIIDTIDGLGKGVKIYGAFASDLFNFKQYRVAFNDRLASSEQAFILISGNIEPKMISVQSISGKANFSYEVTQAKGHYIFRLGNGTFLEALEKSGLSSDKEIVAGEFITTPFVTVLEKPGGIHVEAMRNLTYLNHEKGFGMFLGGVAEGSSLELGLLNADDCKTSVAKAFDELLDWLANEGSNCKTLICNSCTARYLALGNNGLVEADAFKDRLPEGVSLMGLYSYGEFCPIEDHDKWCNVFHNSTFTILCI